MKKIIFFVLILCMLPFAFAEEKYSFEKAEELTPLIEWRDFGPSAFQEAIDSNKPIFLLLTAPSWCYWCQVYESEDYLFHPSVFPYINSNFIPIYVDADKRQDLTRQYLEGGWPSTTIFTPNKERIYGHSGVRPIENMLANLKNAVEYVDGRTFVYDFSYNYERKESVIPTSGELSILINNYGNHILQVYDSTYGGFGTGQKFPQGRTLDFSLEIYEASGNKAYLDLVKNTLVNQYTSVDELKTDYNLFDPVEGGFHRYGTKRDWTPPHYEKMLYDNARLLKAYAHLQQIETSIIVDEVVSKTDSYIQREWYSSSGGFYGNSDVHGEDAYYAENPRPLPKARVEKTKYTDWNSDAILTYLYLWEIKKEEKYRDIAKKSLDFFASEMIGKSGAYHYINSEKGVQGNLLDNAYLLLALVEGYEFSQDAKYLEAAEKITSFSFENLYDWHTGGFFSRNSPDKDNYAPGEHILLSKPTEENGIMAYALLKLYTITSNDLYLDSALKTLGVLMNQVSGLDRGYYHVKAAQYVLKNNLLDVSLEVEGKESFWLDNLLSDDFQLSSDGISMEGPLFILMLVAFFAGLISFASPCTLPILPAFVAYTLNSSGKSMKKMTIAFFLGLATLFTLLGMSATFVGGFLKSQIILSSRITGIVIILFGVYILAGKGFSGFKFKARKPVSYIGSYFFGAAMGLSWTPCVGPILVSILLLASTTNSVFSGGFLLFLYAVGIAVPLFLFSHYLDKKGKAWKFIEGKPIDIEIGKRVIKTHTNTLISGFLFILIGYLILSGWLFVFNQYIGNLGIQKFIFGIEDWLLGLLK